MSVPNPNEFRTVGSSNNSEDLNIGPGPGPGQGAKVQTRHGPVDITRLSHSELVQRVRKLEADLLKLASDHNHLIREANHRIQAQATEISTLNGTIKRLEEDNTELRDLCCFLDDDRQKGRKLAREWQRFGRYTASVMRQEVAAYQSKLRDLDTRQQQLVSDNMELKELCLYLDEERNQNSCSQCGAAFRRDDGDGSSSSTNPAEEYANNMTTDSAFSNASSNSTQGNLTDRDEASRGILSAKIMDYVKRLERRVSELEKQDTISCPESVLNALQVLQVCQGLDDHDIGDQEKALVRQMCNVVWKKLEDNPNL
ncbi:unnamed protein product [Allacma fusca]|uniref:Coiled-coil domain-containing protein 85C n=1 Tax=Allacma fusca TaxID=39272 RepID=A0A8J2P0B7_9HEXA|nr:unnamed protein product [Allacma fusca]